jgi:hypothetical protein
LKYLSITKTIPLPWISLSDDKHVLSILGRLHRRPFSLAEFS